MNDGPSLRVRLFAAVALTAGFFLLALVIGLGLLAAPVLLYIDTGRIQPVFDIVAVLGGAGVLRELFVARTPGEHPGPRITREQEPRLWQEVCAVADAVGQAPPEEIILDLHANAAVAEAGAGLLRPGRRVLLLGLPLLASTSRDELRALLAHEFGHYAGGDTRLSGWVWRTGEMMDGTIAAMRKHRTIQMVVIAAPLAAYARMYLRLTAAISRRQEFAADRVAARVAGRAPALSLLRQIAPIGAAWERCWALSIGHALNAGRRPPLAEALRRYMATETYPAFAGQVLQAREANEQRHALASHPTLRQRLDALSALDAPDLLVHPHPEPALTLIADIAALEQRVIGEEMQPIAWDDVAQAIDLPAARAALGERRQALAGAVVGRPPVTPAALDAIAQTAGTDRNGAGRLVTNGMLVALADAGWTVTAPIGEELLCSREEERIEPGSVLLGLSTGDLDGAEWLGTATRLGIAELTLGPPGFVATVPEPVAAPAPQSYGPPQNTR